MTAQRALVRYTCMLNYRLAGCSHIAQALQLCDENADPDTDGLSTNKLRKLFIACRAKFSTVCARLVTGVFFVLSGFKAHYFLGAVDPGEDSPRFKRLEIGS